MIRQIRMSFKVPASTALCAVDTITRQPLIRPKGLKVRAVKDSTIFIVASVYKEESLARARGRIREYVKRLIPKAEWSNTELEESDMHTTMYFKIPERTAEKVAKYINADPSRPRYSKAEKHDSSIIRMIIDLDGTSRFPTDAKGGVLAYMRKNFDVSSWITKDEACEFITPTGEKSMNRGKDSHDQIFEAMIHGKFYTVMCRPTGGASYAYRVRADMELEEGDQVICEGKGDNFFVAIIDEIHNQPQCKATAWVIQKVDVSEHFDRQESWTHLYEAVRKTEMAKKKAVLSSGYFDEISKHAPEFLEHLDAFKDSPMIESKPETKES